MVTVICTHSGPISINLEEDEDSEMDHGSGNLYVRKKKIPRFANRS
jgi:hypothetical protein